MRPDAGSPDPGVATKGGPAGPPFSSSPEGFLTAFRDVFRGLERCLEPGVAALVKVAIGLMIGWWLYVPVHELLHALGCLATGGTVERLEIAPQYGGQLFARIFPFVHPESEYAGRLSGFSTGGSDFVYLATDLAPFLLTLFPGLWWLRRAGRRGDAVGYGLSLPVALAPLTSATGDAYEIGSIVITWVPPFSAQAELLRGDDVFKKAGELGSAGDGGAWAGFVVAILLGLLWALATLALAGRIARFLGEPAITPRAPSAPSPPINLSPLDGVNFRSSDP